MEETKIVKGGGGRDCQISHFVPNFGRNLNPTNQSKAFTLAEVLITIVIIGVVAAISIPTVITNYQKNQYVTQLKKFYTQTSNGLKAYMASQGVTKLSDTELWAKMSESYPDINKLLSKDANDKPFQDEFNKIFKVLKMYNGDDVQAEHPGLKVKMLNFPADWGDGSESYGSAIVLADGAAIRQIWFDKEESYAWFCGSGHNRDCKSLKEMQQAEKDLNWPITKLYASVMSMVVDVNGFKGPNIYGRDIFRFVIGNDGSLYPNGGMDLAVYAGGSWYKDTTWSSGDSLYNCSFTNGSYGFGCAGRIMEEGWKMNY